MDSQLQNKFLNLKYYAELELVTKNKLKMRKIKKYLTGIFYSKVAKLFVFKNE